MKVSEIPIGTQILLPCSRCGYKRSLKFNGPAWYAKAKEQMCNRCRAEFNADNTGNFCLTRNHMKAPSYEDMG